MPRGTKIQIKLTEKERETLTMWARAGTTQQKLAQRARVILFSEQGLSVAQIRAQTGLSAQNCSKWRKRFLGVAPGTTPFSTPL